MFANFFIFLCLECITNPWTIRSLTHCLSQTINILCHYLFLNCTLFDLEIRSYSAQKSMECEHIQFIQYIKTVYRISISIFSGHSLAGTV